MSETFSRVTADQAATQAEIDAYNEQLKAKTQGRGIQVNPQQGLNGRVVAGEYEDLSSKQHIPGQQVSTQNIDPQSVLASARSQGGRPLSPREITGDSLVSVQGMDITADEAYRMGLLDKGPNGEFVAASPFEQAPADQKSNSESKTQDTPGAESAETLLKHNENIDIALLHRVSNPAAIETIKSHFTETGEVTEEALQEFAGALGGDHAARKGEALELAAEVVNEFYGNAVEAFQSNFGLADQAFDLLSHWAHDSGRSNEVQSATRAFLQDGNLNAFSPLVSDFVAHVENNPDLHPYITNVRYRDGVKVQSDRGNKKLLVTTKDGMQIDFASAVKAGVVRV